MIERRLAIALIASALVLGGATHARAADEVASPDDGAAFKNGLELYAQGNFASAIATWESLLGTLGEDRGYKVLYNLGLAYQAVGDVTKAIERYRAFVARVSTKTDASPDLVARGDDARKRTGQLEATHGAVNVHAPATGEVVLTRIGTSDPRAAGYVVWLSPGSHAIELNVGTARARTVALEIERGKTVDVDTTPPPPPPPPPVVIPSTPPSVAWVWILGGATAASFALPIGAYVAAKSKRDDADALGAGNTGYSDARASYATSRTVFDVSFAVPAVLAAATIAVVAWRRSSGTTHVALGPASLSLDGAF